MTNQAREIRPCPFCGECLVHDDTGGRDIFRHGMSDTCIADSVTLIDAAEIEAWNQRALDTPKQLVAPTEHGDAGDALDWALDHCSEPTMFLEDWRQGLSHEWKDYRRWLQVQRDGAAEARLAVGDEPTGAMIEAGCRELAKWLGHEVDDLVPLSVFKVMRKAETKL